MKMKKPPSEANSGAGDRPGEGRLGEENDPAALAACRTWRGVDRLVNMRTLESGAHDGLWTVLHELARMANARLICSGLKSIRVSLVHK